MSSRRHNLICVLFEKVPKGTHYRKGSYSWVNKPEALDYIEQGFGKEYDPVKAKTQKTEKDPKSDLPEGLPGRNHFDEAGKNWEAVQKLAEKGNLQKVPGIGKSTEHKIKEFINGNA